MNSYSYGQGLSNQVLSGKLTSAKTTEIKI